MNIKLTYLYRDYANYKQFNEVIFENPTRLAIAEIEADIRNKLIDGQWFIAKDWSLPDMHFKQYQWDPETDHSWHEFDSVEETTECKTEAIPILEFLSSLKFTQYFLPNNTGKTA